MDIEEAFDRRETVRGDLAFQRRMASVLKRPIPPSATDLKLKAEKELQLVIEQEQAKLASKAKQRASAILDDYLARTGTDYTLLLQNPQERRAAKQQQLLEDMDEAKKLITVFLKGHKMSEAHFSGEARDGETVRIRHQAFILIYKTFPQWSMTQLGRFFKRDHTTILHALKKAGVM